jgi:fructose-1,6-bisphosphatase
MNLVRCSSYFVSNLSTFMCVCIRYYCRYSGGLVPDVYHILSKGQGVFSNASSKKVGRLMNFVVLYAYRK